MNRGPVGLLLQIPVDRLKHYGVHAAPLLLGTQLERFLLIVTQTKVHSHTTTVPILGPPWYRRQARVRNRVVTHAPTNATPAIGRNTTANAAGWEPDASVAV